MSQINWRFTDEEDAPKRKTPDAFVRFIWAVSPRDFATPLSIEEEHELIIRAQDTRDEQAVSLLVASHERLLVKMARKVARQNGMQHMLLDLSQTAVAAFVEAIQRFKFEPGVRLATFSRYAVGGELLRCALDFRHALAIGKGSDERKAYYNMRAAIDAFVQSNGRAPSQAAEDLGDLAGRLGVSPKAFKRGTDARRMQTMSLDQVEAWVDTPEQEASVDRDQITALVAEISRAVIAPLNSRDRSIIEEYCADPEEFKAAEVAARFGITPERVGQVRRAALHRMMQLFAAKGLDFSDLVA